MKAALLLSSLLVLGAGSAAYAQSVAGRASTTSVTGKAETKTALADLHKQTEENICHTITSTGTHFQHRECHTAFEWKNIENDGAAYALYVQQHASELQFGGH